jgi:predicted transcriptional regulator
MGEHEMAAKERVNVSFFVDRNVREELAELARQEDRSMSSLIRRAIETEIQREREPSR